ncbi:MAG: hypothetical protein WCS42_09970 [Verrucomicrobiota bacterium]
MNLTTTADPMAGGADAVTGIGMDYLLALVGAFQTGDMITLTFTDSTTGLQTQVGAGWATGIQMQYVMTLNDKLYGVAGKTVYFCALADPITWNDPNAAGNGFKALSNSYGMTQDLAALSVYQGKIAAVGRNQVQIFSVDPDPANNGQPQVLPNIGTVAKETVRAVGDMDLYMLGDTGVRSVRVRDASNNAIIADIGTPIDAILQPLLASLTDDQKALACGIVEPTSNRYWVYVPKPDGSAGSIYVFSYFTSSQIAAWGTYNPSYAVAGVQTSFVPTKFCVFKGQVYCRAGDNIYQFGGSTNMVYDNCGASWTMPYVDMGAPGTRKQFESVDMAFEGTWTLKASADFASNVYKSLYANTAPSFQLGAIGWGVAGTHYSFQGVESGSGYARFASVVCHVKAGNEK